MRVGIDVRPALRRKTGVGRYLLGLVPALVECQVDVVAFSSSYKDRLDPRAFAGARCSDWRIPVRLLDFIWHHLRWPPLTLLAGPLDVVHSPTPIPIPATGARQVVTIHDLFFVRSPKAAGGDPARRWIDAMAHLVATVDAFVCVSESTAREANRLLGIPRERLHVVHHGLEPHWRERLPPDEVAATVRALGIDAPYLLCVGTLEERKNLRRMLSAFDRLRRAGETSLKLVFAGPDGNDRPGIDAAVALLGLTQSVVITGYLDDRRLQALYQSARALVMPSLDEGFGFPILEALACGCPVVAAATGALPEVGGDACEYVDPFDEESILYGVQRVLEDTKLVDERRVIGQHRSRRYTWRAAAEKTTAIYRGLHRETR